MFDAKFEFDNPGFLQTHLNLRDLSWISNILKNILPSFLGPDVPKREIGNWEVGNAEEFPNKVLFRNLYILRIKSYNWEQINSILK